MSKLNSQCDDCYIRTETKLELSTLIDYIDKSSEANLQHRHSSRSSQILTDVTMYGSNKLLKMTLDYAIYKPDIPNHSQ